MTSCGSSLVAMSPSSDETRRLTYGNAGMGVVRGQVMTLSSRVMTNFSICGYRVRPE